MDVRAIGAKPAMTVAEAQRRVEAFLTGRMVEALRAIQYRGQLYWRTDIAQMTRYFMLEMVRFGVTLSPAPPAAQSDDGRLA